MHTNTAKLLKLDCLDFKHSCTVHFLKIIGFHSLISFRTLKTNCLRYPSLLDFPKEIFKEFLKPCSFCYSVIAWRKLILLRAHSIDPVFRNRSTYNHFKKSLKRGQFWSYWNTKSLLNYHVSAKIIERKGRK